MSTAELAQAREPLERLASVSSDELDRLFVTTRHAGYAVLLCSNKGVIIGHRGEREEADRYRYWGSWLGAIWSEELEGTNGVGTCIIEQRPITIHRTQHFRGRHIGLSCSSAPIFDHHGQLIAVLDIASIYPDLSESSHAMAGSLVAATARSIEERLFRDTFRACWICAVRMEEAADPGMLFAVDRELRIVAAGLGGLAYLAMRGHGPGTSLWAIFERDGRIFRANGAADRAVQLIPLCGSSGRTALITPPEPRGGSRWLGPEFSAQHTRPRLELLNRFELKEGEFRSRGGLSSLALRRVRDHVDACLDQGVDLQSMARAAGLSVHHFARAFKESEGMTPHCFIMNSRLEKAKRLLIGSEMSLAEIAASSGFADQSHFARCFKRFTGSTPRTFRDQSS